MMVWIVLKCIEHWIVWLVLHCPNSAVMLQHIWPFCFPSSCGGHFWEASETWSMNISRMEHGQWLMLGKWWWTWGFGDATCLDPYFICVCSIWFLSLLKILQGNGTNSSATGQNLLGLPACHVWWHRRVSPTLAVFMGKTMINHEICRYRYPIFRENHLLIVHFQSTCVMYDLKLQQVGKLAFGHFSLNNYNVYFDCGEHVALWSCWEKVMDDPYRIPWFEDIMPIPWRIRMLLW